jgi:DNA mismatch repair protein MutS2
VREAQLAEHLARIDHDMRALEHEHRIAARERETLETAEARIRQREDALRQREETFRRRLTEELDAQVRSARREIDEVIAGLRQRTQALTDQAARRVDTGAPGAARSDARAAVDAVVGKILQPTVVDEPVRAASAPEVTVGARVSLAVLGLEGVVTGLHDGTADVDVRGKRMRASVRDLTVIAGSAPPAPGKVSIHVELQPRDTTPAELNVIGCSVDEALTRAERFLDESLLSDQRVLRFVHGYGTGQLKKAITSFLQKHPLVASVASAPPSQGGGGVTVAELKE